MDARIGRKSPVRSRHRPAPTAGSARVHRLAHVLDRAFRVPGTRFRFGVDPLLGLLPGIGDVLGGVLAGYILYAGVRAGAPRAVLLRMFFNIAFDTFLGAIPLLGDLLDAGWKANTRNVALLERHLEAPARTAAASRAFVVLLLVGLMLLIVATVLLTVALVRWLVGLGG